MIALGILLPSTVLESAWFETLALFVAVNTIVFAALSLVHLVPPRRPRRPRRPAEGEAKVRRG